MNKYLAYIAVSTLIALFGCQEKGLIEKAGERMDNVIDNVKHGDAPLKEEGTMEKMGESIDDAVN